MSSPLPQLVVRRVGCNKPVRSQLVNAHHINLEIRIIPPLNSLRMVTYGKLVPLRLLHTLWQVPVERLLLPAMCPSLLTLRLPRILVLEVSPTSRHSWTPPLAHAWRISTVSRRSTFTKLPMPIPPFLVQPQPVSLLTRKKERHTACVRCGYSTLILAFNIIYFFMLLFFFIQILHQCSCHHSFRHVFRNFWVDPMELCAPKLYLRNPRRC